MYTTGLPGNRILRSIKIDAYKYDLKECVIVKIYNNTRHFMLCSSVCSFWFEFCKSDGGGTLARDLHVNR